MLGGCNADYHSKTWAKDHLRNKPTITIVKNFIDLGFTENRGMIFGILNGKMPQIAGTVAVTLRVLILLALLYSLGTIARNHFYFCCLLCSSGSAR